ncbi:MAG: NAD(P)H-dependent oxidoreductase [Paludibacteraceae bacterium]|nr:NAD(P)H-dependent oxidoreductase [Paludibacteraceae bacterium]
MRKVLFTLLAAAMVASASAQQKVLVAYFSFTNNTKAYAEKIASITGGDLYEIVPQTAYGSENSNYYDETTRAYKEQYNTGGEQRPAIQATLANAAQYDVVFIGSPIWYGKSPRVILTFLDTYGFAGKTVVPFVTSASSGISQVNAELPTAYPNIQWIEGRRLNGISDADLQTWMQGVLESTTGLDEVTASAANAPAYTMSGQQAPEGYKGVIIQNGKKVLR